MTRGWRFRDFARRAAVRAAAPLPTMRISGLVDLSANDGEMENARRWCPLTIGSKRSFEKIGIEGRDRGVGIFLAKRQP